MSQEQQPIHFAYWVPNVSGGLVVSKIEQRTSWDIDYNRKLAQLAERNGFDYALSQIRFTAGYGAEYQHESVAISHALLAATEAQGDRGDPAWPLASCGRGQATGDDRPTDQWPGRGEHRQRLVQGRVHRHRRTLAGARRTLSALRRVHPRAERHLDRGKLHLQGRFLSFPRLHPETQAIQQPHPEIFQGGSSRAARDMASRVSDWYFTNGNSIDGIRAQVEDIRAKAAANGHSVKVGVNAFIIARDTEEEARAVLDEIIAKADYEAVNAFGDAVKQAGKASPEAMATGPNPPSKTWCNTTTASRPT